jgi:hypothetical protein
MSTTDRERRDVADRRLVRVDREHRASRGDDDTCRHRVSPTESGTSEAPMTAIDDGMSRRAMARESARCSRRSTESMNSVGVDEREVDVDHAGVEPPVQRPARLGEHGEHAPVVGQRLRGELLDAVLAGDGGEVLEQQRRDALAVVLRRRPGRRPRRRRGSSTARSSPIR